MKEKKATTPSTKVKKKVKREIPAIGRAYVTAGFNSTLITITDVAGNPICSASSGSAGFKGTKKSTPFAAAQVGLQVSQKAAALGVKEVRVFVKGAGFGRNQAIKMLKQGGLNVLSLADITPMPHDGCRPRKRRRV